MSNAQQVQAKLVKSCTAYVRPSVEVGELVKPFGEVGGIIQTIWESGWDWSNIL